MNVFSLTAVNRPLHRKMQATTESGSVTEGYFVTCRWWHEYHRYLQSQWSGSLCSIIALMQEMNRPHRLRNRCAGLFSPAQICSHNSLLLLTSLGVLIFLSRLPRVYSILESATPSNASPRSPLALPLFFARPSFLRHFFLSLSAPHPLRSPHGLVHFPVALAATYLASFAAG